MDFVGTIEILVLVAIAIELFALYKHTKLENRMDEHIHNTSDRLLRSDEIMKVLNENMMRFDEHMVRFDEHTNKVNEYVTKLDEHLIRFDEHINRLDDLMRKSYPQRTEKGIEETTS